MNNKIRIIAGKWRGRKIEVLVAKGLRPTTDRTREMLFNWLIPNINDSICLDLFAGSGALGFEALSRGAKQVDFVESNIIAYKTLHKNSEQLNAKNLDIHYCNAFNYLEKDLNKYDLIFIDPPFQENYYAKILKFISKKQLKENCIIYLESNKNEPIDETIFIILKFKKTANVFSYLLALK
jgi:16S rRNA (guanine966-N2)-methyltransferase